MARRDKTLSYSFRGSARDLKKLNQLITEALQNAVPAIDPQGPVENWGQSGGWVRDLGDGWSQSGGWYLVVENQESVRVSNPDPSLTKVTDTVYKALSKAIQR